MQRATPTDENILPSRYSEGNSPSGDMTTGPSGKASPSYNGRRIIYVILDFVVSKIVTFIENEN